MIVPRGVVAPLALLTAVATATIVMYAGIGHTPEAFWGSTDAIVIGPLGAVLPGKGTVDASFADQIRTLPGIRNVSVEVFVLTTIQGRSALVRGADVPTFLSIEDAHLTSGRLPDGSGEALVGESFRSVFHLGVGDTVTLPGMLTHVALPITIVGVFGTSTPARDHLLVPLDTGRILAGVPARSAHILRVDAEAPAAVRARIDSVQPVFSYSDVKLSATELVPNETIHLTGSLTNWGQTGGTKFAEVRADGDVIAQRAYYVAARETVHIALDLVLTKPGVSHIKLNPEFDVHVHPTKVSVSIDPTAVAPGAPLTVTVLAEDGSAAQGVEVALGESKNVTDAHGRAGLLAPLGSGRAEVVARVNGTPAGRAGVLVLPSGAPPPTAPLLAVTAFHQKGDLIVANRTATFELDITNHGIQGTRSLVVLLDGEVAYHEDVTLEGGASRTVTVTLPSIGEGRHILELQGSGTSTEFMAYGGANPYASWLRDHVESQSSGQIKDATDEYVKQILGNVSLAIFALSIVSGLLAAAGAVAVLSRHLAERGSNVGTLKSIGATDKQVLERASREAVRYGAIASIIGVLVGVLLARVIEATGLVRAFGSAVHPEQPWYLLVLIALVTTDFVVIVTRLLVRGLLRLPPGKLLQGRIA